jgi:HAD superfamily hydrolase (TIGR01490 family)
MLLYKLGMIAPDKAKQKVLISFFGGKPTRIIDNIAIRYAKDRIPSILRSKAISKLLWHKSQGHKVVIVSASPSIWIKPWADLMEVSLISTKIKIIKHKYTGEIEGKNCNGEQKALCIKKRYNLHDYTDIYAYGDSKGDKQMLNLADHAFYNNF